jgi:putative nucleotidyltransferase with HDIG domain
LFFFGTPQLNNLTLNPLKYSSNWNLYDLGYREDIFLRKEERFMVESDRKRLENFLPSLAEIKDLSLREKVIDIWLKAWKESNFENIDSPSQWEARRDEVRLSNVEHTNQVTQCSISAAKVVEETQKIKINFDYLIAGALLHDVDKFLIHDAKTAGPSPLGKQFSHTFLGAHLVLAAGLPPEVAHIVASHSPYSSSVEPQSIEALIVHATDDLMFRSWSMKQNIKIDTKRILHV